MEALAKKHLVYVEPTNIVTSPVDGSYAIKPYRDRRPMWGVTLALEYNSYEPINYEPNFATATYTDVYKAPSLPLIEFELSVKRNLDFGSVGGEFAVGTFKNNHVTHDSTGAATYGNSTLSITPIRLGAVYYLDTLSSEPYVVPYVSGGAYMLMFSESLGGNSFNGNTQPAPYANFGLAFSLGWIDRDAARLGYVNSGVEATYFILEGRKLFASSAKKDPDFSNDIDWAAGVKVEF